MTLLCLCAVIVSLSELAFPKESAVIITPQSGAILFPPEEKEPSKTIPIYAAILAGFGLPTFVTLQCVAIKYVDAHLHLRATDYTTAFWGMMSLAFFIVGAISYSKEFEFRLWINGCIGSVLNLLGSVFWIAAMQTGYPAGPIVALVSSQTIIVTIIDAIAQRTAPNWI